MNILSQVIDICIESNVNSKLYFCCCVKIENSIFISTQDDTFADTTNDRP